MDDLKNLLRKVNLVYDQEFKYLHINPIPNKQDIEQYYKEEYYKNEGGTTSSLKVQESQTYCIENRYNDILFRINQYFDGKIENRNLLDIGCGFSKALLFFREKGFVVKGIEASDEGVAYAKAQNLDVTQAIVENISQLDLGKFDIITLFEVLEHLREPIRLLQQIQTSLLKENGMLIIDVPNEFNDFQVAANQEYKLNEWWVCPPEHINYFSRDSLEHILEKCGYEIFHAEASFPIEMFLLMGEVYIENQQVGAECHNKRVLFEKTLRENGKMETLRNFYAALAQLNLGRSTTIYAINRNKTNYVKF